MRRFFKVFLICALSTAARAQCDTTGILLELQATSNLQGILFSNDRCLVAATVLSPLYISGDTLGIDTTGLGGGGSGIDTVKVFAPAAGFTVAGSPGIAPVATFTFSLANDLLGVENLGTTGFAVRTGTSTWDTRTIVGGAGISVVDGDGVADDPVITNTGDLSNTNEAWTIDADDAETEVISNQTVKFQGGGILVTDYIPGTDILSLVATEVDGSITNEIQIGNNGVSDNEDSGKLRLGNRYMNTPDAPFTMDRKVNLDAKMLFVGDNTDSLLLVADGTNDRIGIGRLPSNRLDIEGTSGTYTRVGTSGAVANAGVILNNTADAADTWAVYRQGDGDFAIGADADNQWPNGTLTDPFIIKPSPPDNSFYMDAAGFIELNGTAPARRFDNNGETRLRDLVTDNPTVLVGADGDGDLSSVTLGTNLSFTGTTLNATGGTFYQTWRDDGVAVAQQPNANFVSTARISTLLVNDGGNSETEASFDVVANSIGNTHIRQGVARSVIGVTGNATANVADIQSGGADLPLVTNAGNTAISFAQLATGGITNDAVTYAKIQNAAANNVVLGNNNGAGTDFEELTVANLYTMLGMTGVANRFAIWTGANTLTSDAAYTFDAANDRMTVNGTVAGLGANNAFLNLNSGAIAGATTFLRMSGNITSNMIAELVNANNAAGTSNSLFTISTGGAVAGDPVVQFNIAGVVTHAFGIDNSNNDKIMLTPNSATPGGVANASFVGTKDAVPLWGFNIDAPIHPLDVGGVARAVQFRNTGNLYTSANVTFHAGAGTGPTFGSISGGNNWLQFNFNTGTAPTADADIFTITYPNAYAVLSYPTFSPRTNPGGGNMAAEIDKWYITTAPAGSFTMRAKGTLTASTTYSMSFSLGGY